MSRRLALSLMIAVVAGLAPVIVGCARDPPPEIGRTATAERTHIERIVVATGTIEPEKKVEVRPRISGIIEKVHVDDGDIVDKDALLIEIDRELLEAQAAEARSRLEQSKVELHYAIRHLRRAAELAHGGTVSQQEHERAEARSENATAAVARDQAAVDSLEVELKYTRVLAPMHGKILDVPVEPGDAVSAVTTVTGGTFLLVIAASEEHTLRAGRHYSGAGSGNRSRNSRFRIFPAGLRGISSTKRTSRGSL